MRLAESDDYDVDVFGGGRVLPRRVEEPIKRIHRTTADVLRRGHVAPPGTPQDEVDAKPHPEERP